MYLYEMHLHTCQGSKCGKSEGKEYPALYKALGYDGIFVTDHFFQGNCAVPHDLPWEERVRLYMLGYLDAKAKGDRIGLDVFFGIEQCFPGHDEMLAYGIDREFLLAHPDMEGWSRARFCREVQAYGGCVVQPHPFRERDYLDIVQLSPYTVDGIEVVNLGNNPWEDLAALRYAARLGKVITCGSDIHTAAKVVRGKTSGVLLQEKLTCEKDYARAVREGRIAGICYDQKRYAEISLRKPTLPVLVYGTDDSIVSNSADEWLD